MRREKGETQRERSGRRQGQGARFDGKETLLKTVFKYLKPFAALVVISLAFLFLQAYCDLTLPNIMSGIVNVGIQLGGIEEQVPERMSREAMSLVTAFMTPEGAEYFEGLYSLEDDVYTASEGAQEDTAAAAYYGDAAYSLVKFVSEGSPSHAGAESGEFSISDVDINELYAALLPVLEQFPQGALNEAYSSPEGQSVGAQTGALLTGMFYRELGVDTGKLQTDYILKEGGLMLAVALAAVAASLGVGFLSSRIGAGLSRDLRLAVFSKIESFSSSEFDKFSTASLITRSTNDVQQVQMLVTMGLRMVCYAPIMGVGGVVMALGKSVSLSWVIAVAVAVMLGIILVLFSVVMPRFKRRQSQIDRLNLVSREQLSGLMVIRAFGNESYEEKRFAGANGDLTATTRFVQRAAGLMVPFMTVIMNGITVAIIWLGSHEIAESTLQVGDMLAFMQYAMHIIMSFLMIAMMFIVIPQASVSATRIAEVLNTENSIKNPDSPRGLPKTDGGRTVEFRDVSFSYDRAEDSLLEGISFTARPGETTAIIGLTGSGKSTLINLIPRFYDVSSGSVRIDGVDVRELSLSELRDAVGFVPQKGLLFSGTVESNVRYAGQAVSDEDERDALRVSQSWEFVSQLPEGTASPIAQGGGNVSGGQRQRLAIARALAKRPSVYVFDDSFSALDYKTDAKLRRELRGFTEDATVIIVAQRVSTIMNAEQILVLDAGRIVGRGTHSELLQSCEEYRDIAESQLSPEDLRRSVSMTGEVRGNG